MTPGIRCAYALVRLLIAGFNGTCCCVRRYSVWSCWWWGIFFMFRTETDVDPDAGLDEVDQSEAVSEAEPKHDS